MPNYNSGVLYNAGFVSVFRRDSPSYLSDGTQVAANVPRFESGKFAQAWLGEEGTTNLAQYPKMDTDSNSDGVVDGFAKSVYSCTPVYVLDGAQKITMSGATVSNAYAEVRPSVYITVSAGTTYTLSIETKLVRTAAETIELGFIWYDTNITYISNAVLGAQNPGTDYKRLSLTATAPTNAASAAIFLRLRASSVTDTGSAWFRNFQLEPKPYVTSFINGTRSPETLTIPTAGVLSIPCTLEAWAKTDMPAPGDTYWRSIFNGLDVNSIPLNLQRDPSGKLYLYYRNSADTANIGVYTGFIVDTNWHYYAVVYLGSTIKVYVDGVLKVTVTDALASLRTGTYMLIGRSGQVNECWNGLIDDLRISSKARTDAEISAAYASGTPLPVDEWTTWKQTFDGTLENSASPIRTKAYYNSGTLYIVEVSDAGQAQELLSMLANIFASESVTGVDSLDVKQFPADAYFVVTCEGDLNPLGVIVLRDSRHELMPETRDNTEEIPGRHGEIDFGSEFKARGARLHVATYDGLTPMQKEQMKRTIAKYLNPVAGTKKLVFLYDIGKQYIVKLDGRIEPTEYADWFEFEIPLKMSDPFIESTEEHSLIGSGTITNAGNFETGLVVEIAGPVTNPSVTIGTDVLSYTGTIASGQTLVIDTEAQTAKIGNTNAAGNYNGVFPMLPPGDTTVTASSNVTIKWRDKWI